MDHNNTYSKSSNFTSFTPINNIERSSTITYGDGYVYTGPLIAQQYEISSKSTSEISKQTTPPGDGQNLNSSSSPSITNLSLSTSPSTEVVNSNNNTNQYQFKVMLLGDSGVGKFRLVFICFLFFMLENL
jgi:hypothetical protein